MRAENIALLRRGYEAFAKGDLDTIRRISSDDGVWRTPGFSPFESEYKGVDGTIEYLAKLFELTDGTFAVEPVTFVADDDDRVFVLGHVTAMRKGRLLDTEVVHMYMVRDGKVFETTEFVPECGKLAAFWD